jgi:hypothetical protein
MQTMQKSVHCQAHYKNDKLPMDTRSCLFSKLLAFEHCFECGAAALLLAIDLHF